MRGIFLAMEANISSAESGDTELEDQPNDCEDISKEVPHYGQSSQDQEQAAAAERVARLQQYRQGMWELNFDYRNFERWRQVGISQGLASDTEIACFLMLHYETTRLQSEAVQNTCSKCKRCGSLLPRSCSICKSTDLTAGYSQLQDAAMETGAGARNEETLETLQDYLLQDKDQSKGQGVGQTEEKMQLFPCPSCSATFNGAASLKVHRRKHTVHVVKNHLAFTHHFPTHRVVAASTSTTFEGSHNADIKHDSSDSTRKRHKKTTSVIIRQEDAILLKRLRQNEAVTRNERQVDNLRKMEVGAGALEGSLVINEVTIKCGRCSKSLAVPFDRSPAMRIHYFKKRERPYVCNDCGAFFTHASSLSVHKRSHSGLKPFICERCGAAFAVGSVLKQHMRKHSGEKPYTCKLCPSAFTQSTKLTIHMRTHTGIRPYQCERCGAAFTHSHRLKIHLRSHSGDRPYKCPQCGKGFTQSAHLTVHTRIHTGHKPFRCQQCGAAFLDSTHLRRHQRTHTAEKPHRCQDCGVSYSTAFALRRHEWTHTDSEKPFKCSKCCGKFTTNFCLKRHQARGRCKIQESDLLFEQTID